MLTTDRTTPPATSAPAPPPRPAWVLPTAVGAAVAASAAAGVLAAMVLLTPAGRPVGEPAPAPSTAAPSAPAGAAPATPAPAPRPGQSTGQGTGKQAGTGTGAGSSAPALRPEPYADVPAKQAVAMLEAAGMTPAGEVLDAGRWTDRNGRNLLVVTRHVDARDASGTMTAATIGVLHVAHLESRPVVLRRMTDPSGPACEFDFVSAVGRDYQIAGDLDGDGYLEVSVAWDTSCLSEADRSTVKVALLSNGRKYILRGLGWPYGSPAGSSWPAAQVVETEPAAPSWPAGFRDRAGDVFQRLYG